MATTKKATLYDPAGKAKPVVVAVGSKSASDLQTKGWTLTNKTKQATPGALPVAKNKPTDAPLGDNTLKGYNEAGKEVYVKPGEYYQGISATPVTNLKEAGDVINNNQEADYNQKTNEEAPPTRNNKKSDILNEYTSLFDKNIKPDAPSLKDEYSNLRESYDITSLETELADKNKEYRDVLAARKARKDFEASKPVAMGVIQGKQDEITRQENEKLDRITREKTYISDQLNAKYSLVNTMMNLTQSDYQNSVASYNSQFNQNMQMINLVRGVENNIKSEEQKAKDDARANLTIMSNAIVAGNINFADLPVDQKALITKLEMQSGLPIGFTESLKSKNPDSDIISTTTRTEANGNKYADIIMRDKDGKITTEHQLLGKEKVSGDGVSSVEKERKQEVANFKKDAADWVEKLGQKDEYGNLKYDWGTAYDSMKIAHPQFVDLIDESLGGGQNEDGSYYGRAKR